MRFLLCLKILHPRASGIMSGALRNFGQLIMVFSNGHESLESNVSCFRCVILMHFDGLKICFLKFPETLGSRFRGYRWTHILHFGGLEMRFLAGIQTISPRVLTSSQSFFFASRRHENAFPRE
jgi:hypothetical protein